MTLTITSPADNLCVIREELKVAMREAGRAMQMPTITVVSKTRKADEILPVLKAGHRVFGENRVQEASAKWPALREAYAGVELRLIGPLQTNKAAEAVALFDAIETVDRPKLARILAAEMKKQRKFPALFVQVNTGEEDQKAGIAPEKADAFIGQCREEYGLTVAGLMCIPPVNCDPAPHFALLTKLAARNEILQISMGMSADYVVAAQLGASHVRIGSGVFGPREQ